MRRACTIMLLAVAGPIGGAGVLARPALDLMPLPASVRPGEGVLVVDAGFTVSVRGGGATARLEEAVRRMLRRLSDRTGLFLPPETFLELDGRQQATLVVTSHRAGELRLGEDESYTLQVTTAGVVLEAATDLGALHGLETLLQLVRWDGRGVMVPAVDIEDAPRFPWRGLMIDSSRHFMPVEVIRRNLDGMAAVKLNVLHWHLCDDQGFRFESLAFPRLHGMGSDGRFYTRAQMREVVDAAAARGIRVVPELDLPGHATSWLVGHPELGSQPGPYRIERGWGIFKPTVDPTREEVYAFLDSLFGEVADVFDDEYVHIGGDENTGEHWAANEQIQAFMAAEGLADAHALQQYFSQRMQRILAGHGRRMMGWDEILQPELPDSVVIHSWRGRESLYQAARRGYASVLSNGYYIDLIQPAHEHYRNDPLPADAPLDRDEQRLVLGGEATMWAEFVTPETVDSRIWPRTAAIAERLWSPREVDDVDDMYRRLDRISLLLEEVGLQHERNRPVMLRRLCGCRDIGALEILLGAVEPVKIYRRGQLRAYTSFSPLTRLVDAAWPDARPARDFRTSVQRLIEGGPADRPEVVAVRDQLGTWQANHEALRVTLQSSPALAEVESLSEDLSTVASIGLEALELIGRTSPAPEGWLETRLAALESARRPRGEAELMIVDPVRDLVCAAAGRACATNEPVGFGRRATGDR